MENDESVFEKTYRDYLGQVFRLDFSSLEYKLGVEVKENEITIPLFKKPHKISKDRVSDPNGKRPTLDICVILFKYLLLCPEVSPFEKEWVSFKDFKDSGPLTTYFANDVERNITSYFSGKMPGLEKACKNLDGYEPGIDAAYDLSVQFNALPRVPSILLFNEADDEFPAKCSVLFERRAEQYLDPESLAMLGYCLFTYLKRAAAF